MFKELDHTPLDSIMLANYEWPDFKAAHQNAINTTIGVMVDPDTGNIWRPQSVTRARENALAQINSNQQFGYQPMRGNSEFIAEANKFVFNESADDIFSYQTLGGTGALSLISETLLYLMADSPKLILDPGWPNHDVIFRNFEIQSYEHIDANGNYNHGQLLQRTNEAPEGSAMLLQVSGYNGDGVDRSEAEWDELIEQAKSKKFVLILDAAYLGLVKDLLADTYPIRKAKEAGVLTFASISFSKNMGLYNERLGAMLIINSKQALGEEQSQNLDSVVNKIIRRTVSSVPLLVSAAAADTLQDKSFYSELTKARESLLEKRAKLVSIVGDKFAVIGKGSGLFTKLYDNGFSDAQYKKLREQGILTLKNSRLNIGGIKFDQVEKLGLALRDL